MKNFQKQTIGEIVDRLIYIKDNYGIEDRGDLEALNNACNILNHRFNSSNPADVLIYEYFSDIHWQDEDIKTTLKEEGYEPSDENVEIVLENVLGFSGKLQDACIEAGWPVIQNAIEECKGKLRPIVVSKED